MWRFLPSTLSELPRLTITAGIDIVIVAILIYQFLLIVRAPGGPRFHGPVGACGDLCGRYAGETGAAAHHSGDAFPLYTYRPDHHVSSGAASRAGAARPQAVPGHQPTGEA